MRIYLAARYSRFPEMAQYAKELTALGHTVTSRWILGDHDIRAHGQSDADHYMRLWAQEDWEDLCAADVVISFTEAPVESNKLPPLHIPPADEVEEWRPVQGSRLNYMVSSFGRIQNGDGEIIHGKIHHKGYRRVLPNGKHGKVQAVHQLVAAAFLGPCPDGYEIDHCDTRKTNNWVGNLEYVTHAENIRRSELYGLPADRRGENNGRAKLTWDDVADIRAAAAQGVTKAELSRQYEVTDVTIGNIVSGKLWPIRMDDEGRSRGGRHCEHGMALALGKVCWVVGYRENVFHWLPEVQFAATWDEVLQVLQP